MTDYFKQASDILAKQEDVSDWSDEKWAGKVMTQVKKLRHADWLETNTKIIEESGLDFTYSGNGTMLFRGNRSADLYPSTGRWRVPGKTKTYRGGAKNFIRWLAGKEV